MRFSDDGERVQRSVLRSSASVVVDSLCLALSFFPLFSGHVQMAFATYTPQALVGCPRTSPGRANRCGQVALVFLIPCHCDHPNPSSSSLLLDIYPRGASPLILPLFFSLQRTHDWRLFPDLFSLLPWNLLLLPISPTTPCSPFSRYEPLRR